MSRFLQNNLQIISENKDLIHVIQKGNTTSRMMQNIFTVIRPFSYQIIQNSYQDSSECEKEYFLEYRLEGIINMIVKWLNDDMVIPIEQMQQMIIKIVSDVPIL